MFMDQSFRFGYPILRIHISLLLTLLDHLLVHFLSPLQKPFPFGSADVQPMSFTTRAIYSQHQTKQCNPSLGIREPGRVVYHSMCNKTCQPRGDPVP